MKLVLLTASCIFSFRLKGDDEAPQYIEVKTHHENLARQKDEYYNENYEEEEGTSSETIGRYESGCPPVSERDDREDYVIDNDEDRLSYLPIKIGGEISLIILIAGIIILITIICILVKNNRMCYLQCNKT